MQRLLNIFVALDSLVWVLLTLGKGHPGETISSAAYRAELHGKAFGKTRPVIDWLLAWLHKDHCQKAYFYAVHKLDLPADMR